MSSSSYKSKGSVERFTEEGSWIWVPICKGGRTAWQTTEDPSRSHFQLGITWRRVVVEGRRVRQLEALGRTILTTADCLYGDRTHVIGTVCTFIQSLETVYTR
eukprot:GHVP01019563.1.p1 GENE.GHVP01019563.1~~GHVP01019563.1.p1  ORF type:complete len:103 (-),score=4.93 GHVP01019563.1:499-807(-)